MLAKLGLREGDALPPSAREMLEGVLEGNRGRLEVIDAEDLARRLRDRTAEAFGQQFQSSVDKPERLPLPGNLELTKERKDGRFQLQGSLRAEEHPVNQLMKDLELNPSSFGPEVRKVIDGVRGADLGHPATWNGFVRDLAVASVKDKPLAALGAEGGSKVGGAAESGAAGLGLGLEKTAKSVGAKESRLEDSPELLMNSERVRNPEQEGRRQETVFRLQGALADAGLSKEQLEDLGPLLDKVLRRGQLKGGPTEKAWAIVGNLAEAQHGKPLPKGEVKETPEGPRLTSLVAAAHLFDLAETKYGAKLDLGRVDGVARILEDFVSAGGGRGGPEAKRAIKLSAVKTPASPKTGAGRPTAGVAEAHEHAKRMGFDPESPQAKHTVKDMEVAFAQILGDGKKSDREVVKAALAWLDTNTKGAEANLGGHLENILRQEPKNPELDAEIRRFVLGRVALCAAAGPEAYTEHLRRQVASAGPGMAAGGGAPAVPGVFDKYGVSNPMLRQAMGASILYDPALSHEDRILLLLMLITQHMDQDRLRKMDELGALDRKDAAAAAKEPPQGPPGDGKEPAGAATPPNPSPPPPAEAKGPEKARDVVMMELDRIGKMRDQIFTALQEIIKRKDESVRGVIQSMQR